MAPSDPGGCKVIMMIDTICMNTMRMKSKRERERERERERAMIGWSGF